MSVKNNFALAFDILQTAYGTGGNVWDGYIYKTNILIHILTVESTWEYGCYPGSHVQIDSSYTNIGKVFRAESRPLEMKWNTEKVGRQ